VDAQIPGLLGEEEQFEEDIVPMSARAEANHLPQKLAGLLSGQLGQVQQQLHALKVRKLMPMRIEQVHMQLGVAVIWKRVRFHQVGDEDVRGLKKRLQDVDEACPLSVHASKFKHALGRRNSRGGIGPPEPRQPHLTVDWLLGWRQFVVVHAYEGSPIVKSCFY